MRITTNAHSIGAPVIKHAGNVELRVTGLKPVASADIKPYTRNAVRLEAQATPHTLALNGAPKTPKKMSAALRVLNEVPSSESVPWFMTGMVAAPYMPQTFKGILPQAIAVMVAARLAPFILPTVALATALFPRQLGDAGLYVPIDPSGHKPTDGFKPLDDKDPVLAGVPHTQYTRPPTPNTRELPITDTSEPQLHEGGAPVNIAPAPGKARATQHWTDNILLASEIKPDAANLDIAIRPSLEKEALSFADVKVSVDKFEASSANGPLLVPDKRLQLTFQTDKHGEGKVFIRYVSPVYRSSVHAVLEKPAQLSNRLAGEVLARALGYTQGFIPSEDLNLLVRDIQTGQLIDDHATSEIARWAMALHGRSAQFGQRHDSNDMSFVVSPNFRTKAYAFERPTTLSGASSDGPGLKEQKIFVSTLSLARQTPNGKHGLPDDVFYVRDLNTLLSAQKDLPDQVALKYVITLPSHEEDPPELRLSIDDEKFHSDISEGRDVLAADTAFVVYDPNFGLGGGYRTQVLLNTIGGYAAWGKQPKKAAETGFQTDLDGDGRWLSIRKPVSVDPFAGLQVTRLKGEAGSPVQYQIRVPDARAIDFKGAPPDEANRSYPDLVSITVEPVTGQTNGQALARILDIQMEDDLWPFSSTFIGQTLAAVQLKDAATKVDQHFTGLLVSKVLMDRLRGNVHVDHLIDGLTIYGIEKKLGAYSPEMDFVAANITEDGTTELSINPEVFLTP